MLATDTRDGYIKRTELKWQLPCGGDVLGIKHLRNDQPGDGEEELAIGLLRVI